MQITLDPLSSVPLFQQLHDRIMLAIARGQLVEGDQLASVRAVAVEFGINPATVKKAYDLLREEGLVDTADRSGSIVIAKPGNNDRALSDADRDQLRRTLALTLCKGYSAKTILAESEQIIAGLATANTK